MLKFGKFLMVGMLMATVGMFVPSCDSDPEEPTEPQEYWAEIIGGKIINDETGNPYTSDRIPFYADDRVEVEVFADNVPNGKEFSNWTISPGSVTYVAGYDRSDNPTKFYMPTRNITITANFEEIGEPTGYTAEIFGGHIYNDATDDYDLTFAIYYAGDPISVFVYADDIPEGQEFYSWTISGSQVTFADGYDRHSNPTSFTMPARNIEITANFADEGVVEPASDDAYIRFTWRLDDQDDLWAISASAEDVATWYNDVYMAEDYIEEDASEIPLGKGSVDIPNNVYSRTAGSLKGEYFKITPLDPFDEFGEEYYTAVATLEDEFGYTDIVANYEVYSASQIREIYEGTPFEFDHYGDLYFEVAFYIAEWLDGGDPEDAWDWDLALNDEGTPMLSKSAPKKFVKKLVKKTKYGEITYYALHRLKKNG